MNTMHIMWLIEYIVKKGAFWVKNISNMHTILTINQLDFVFHSYRCWSAVCKRQHCRARTNGDAGHFRWPSKVKYNYVKHFLLFLSFFFFFFLPALSKKSKMDVNLWRKYIFNCPPRNKTKSGGRFHCSFIAVYVSVHGIVPGSFSRPSATEIIRKVSSLITKPDREICARDGVAPRVGAGTSQWVQLTLAGLRC